MKIKPTIDIADDLELYQELAKRPQGYKLKNGYNISALDEDELKLVIIARRRMSEFIGFIEVHGMPRNQQRYFEGAAAAINDFMCSIGYGDAVMDLTEHLNAITEADPAPTVTDYD